MEMKFEATFIKLESTRLKFVLRKLVFWSFDIMRVEINPLTPERTFFSANFPAIKKIM